jgi:hypothetical protein
MKDIKVCIDVTLPLLTRSLRSPSTYSESTPIAAAVVDSVTYIPHSAATLLLADIAYISPDIIPSDSPTTHQPISSFGRPQEHMDSTSSDLLELHEVVPLKTAFSSGPAARQPVFSASRSSNPLIQAATGFYLACDRKKRSDDLRPNDVEDNAIASAYHGQLRVMPLGESHWPRCAYHRGREIVKFLPLYGTTLADQNSHTDKSTIRLKERSMIVRKKDSQGL